MSDPAMTRILVTGGTGFIGRYVVDTLVKDGLRPLVTTFKETGLGRVDVDTAELDLTDLNQTHALIDSYKPQIALHLAGVTGNSDPTGKIYHDLNFTGTVNILTALEKTGVKRVVMIGSAAEYGSQPIPFREEMASKPVSHYGFSKAQANQFALERHAATGLPVTILRVFTAYGFGQPGKMFLAQVIKHALLNRHFKMSDGLQKRDFVHVNDVVAAIKSSMTADKAVGRIINIAGGKGIALRDLALYIWKICGADGDKLQIGVREKTGDDNFDTEADISLAAEILNWRPGPAILSESGESPGLTEAIQRMQSVKTSEANEFEH